jgi:hypothetical protein
MGFMPASRLSRDLQSMPEVLDFTDHTLGEKNHEDHDDGA